MTGYLRPTSLHEALAFLEETRAVVAAGCTDLFPATERRELSGPVLDITAIDGLRGLTCAGGVWRIGATTTWSDVIATDLPPAFDMLKEAAREVGSVQIQNAGTVAGNLCNASPAADGVPGLLALDASVRLTSRAGERVLPLAEFLTGPRQTALEPGEMMTAIELPEGAVSGNSRFLKLGARRYLVISISMAAARLTVKQSLVSDVALAVGACSAVAQRLPAVEAVLIGQPADTDLVRHVDSADVQAALSPIDDIRADASYRHIAATELIRRAIADLVITKREAA